MLKSFYNSYLLHTLHAQLYFIIGNSNGVNGNCRYCQGQKMASGLYDVLESEWLNFYVLFFALIYRGVCGSTVNSLDDSARITCRQIIVNYLHRRVSRKALLLVQNLLSSKRLTRTPTYLKAVRNGNCKNKTLVLRCTCYVWCLTLKSLCMIHETVLINNLKNA